MAQWPCFFCSLPALSTVLAPCFQTARKSNRFPHVADIFSEDFPHRITGLTRKLEMESREDEARMWSILCILRFPDADAFYNQGVLLNKMSLA